MTTKQILSDAFACMFGIDVQESGYYYGQNIEFEIEIDHASFGDYYDMDFDIDNDHFEAATEDGSEGVWVGVFRVHYDADARDYTRQRVGAIKTLSEGRVAWRYMGALAGELAYLADRAAWRIHKAATDQAEKRRKELAAFVASVLLDGGAERKPLTYDDAFTALWNWVRDGVELPEGITPSAFTDEWNRQVAEAK